MSHKIAEARSSWEYADFVFTDWQPPHSWVSLADHEQYTARLARQFFFQAFERQIITALQEWYGQGWEHDTEVGPDALRLRASNFTGASIDASDVVLWVLTLGIALVIHFILGSTPRHFVRYEPLEFRIPMRRGVTGSVIQSTL